MKKIFSFYKNKKNSSGIVDNQIDQYSNYVNLKLKFYSEK